MKNKALSVFFVVLFEMCFWLEFVLLSLCVRGNCFVFGKTRENNEMKSLLRWKKERLRARRWLLLLWGKGRCNRGRSSDIRWRIGRVKKGWWRRQISSGASTSPPTSSTTSASPPPPSASTPPFRHPYIARRFFEER